jgi:hypothetical protein
LANICRNCLLIHAQTFQHILQKRMNLILLTNVHNFWLFPIQILSSISVLLLLIKYLQSG